MKKKERITLERTFAATIDEVWAMWTTKDGIESWWGPGGFAVFVRELDVRPGGTLLYEMRAMDPEMIAFCQRANVPVSTVSRITYTEVIAPRRLEYHHPTDFIPDRPEPYDVVTTLDLHAGAHEVRMILTFDAMHSEEWTRRQTMGWESELAKLATALEGAR